MRFIASAFLWIGISTPDCIPSGYTPLQTGPCSVGIPQLTGVTVARLPDKPALMWTFKTGGPVKSSAAIVGGRVFIGSSDSNLYCLQRSDGRKVWSFPSMARSRFALDPGRQGVLPARPIPTSTRWRPTPGKRCGVSASGQDSSSPNWVAQSSVTNRRDILVGG